MAGQALPQRILTPFASGAPSGDITAPFPDTSQIGITPGAASFIDGFPPLCFLDPADGGVLPGGADFNGVLNVLSGWAAFFAAGQYPPYDATLQTAMVGYAVGARVAQAAAPTAFWINYVAGNTTDPDTGGAGWASSAPMYSTAALTGSNDVVLPGLSDYVIDVDTTSAARTFTGFVAQRAWQKLTLCVTGANQMLLNPLTGSAAANQIRLSAGGIATLLDDSISIQYVPTLAKWVQI